MRICRAFGGMLRTIAARAAGRRSGYRARAMAFRRTPAARLRAALLTLVLVGALLAPARAAFAQGSPFQGLPSAPQTVPQQTVTTTSGSLDDGGIASWQQVLIVIAGVVLLTGIAIAIVRDARSRAPMKETDIDAGKRGSDAHQTAKATKQKQRAKAKAARQARRRNR